jgi:DNA-binding HxlR family transcriptional regulator
MWHFNRSNSECAYHMRATDMGGTTDCDSICPVARSLSVLGDRWTLLIMRELSFGVRRFDDIQAMTGMSSFLLSARLKRLEKEGVIQKRMYTERPPRYEYHATAMGKDLDEVMVVMRAWSMKWQKKSPHEEDAMHIVHKRSKKVLDVTWRPTAGKPFSFDDTEGTMGRTFAAERDALRKKFNASRGRA